MSTGPFRHTRGDPQVQIGLLALRKALINMAWCGYSFLQNGPLGRVIHLSLMLLRAERFTRIPSGPRQGHQCAQLLGAVQGPEPQDGAAPRLVAMLALDVADGEGVAEPQSGKCGENPDRRLANPLC
jgi:hypothetical protein